MLEQVTYDKVHALAVADGRVPFYECVQYIPKRYNISLYVLRWVIRKRSLQIQFYLVETRVRIVDIMVPQNIIIIIIELFVDLHQI